MDVKKLGTDLLEGAKKNSPAILTGLAVAGVVTTVIFSVKATPKAMAIIEEMKPDWKKAETKEEKKEVAGIFVKRMAPVAAPPLCIGTATIACMIGATNINYRRNAALIAAYNLSESKLVNYRGKVKELLGEKKDQAINDAVAKEVVQKNQPTASTEVIFTQKGKTLCYDELSGRYFESDIEKIRQAINLLNDRMFREMTITVNELYYELGLPETKTGDMLEWRMENGLIQMDPPSAQVTEEGQPCLVISFYNPPTYRW